MLCGALSLKFNVHPCGIGILISEHAQYHVAVAGYKLYSLKMQQHLHGNPPEFILVFVVPPRFHSSKIRLTPQDFHNIIPLNTNNCSSVGVYHYQLE